MALGLGQCQATAPGGSPLAEAGSQPLHLVPTIKSPLGLCNQITKEPAGRFLELCPKSSFPSLPPTPMVVRTVLPPLLIHQPPPDPELEMSKLSACQGRQTEGEAPQEHRRSAEDQSMTTLLQEAVAVESDLVV